MMVERYPNLKKEIGSSIPGCEISSLLDRNQALAYRPYVSKKKEMKKKKKGDTTVHGRSTISIEQDKQNRWR